MKTLMLYCLWLPFTIMACKNNSMNPEEDNRPNLRTLSSQEKEIVSSSNAFAFDLFQALEAQEEGKNLFFSPLSVGFALHMAINGASGETKENMKEVLGQHTLSDLQANQAVKDLTELLLSMDKKTCLDIANSVWYDDQLTLRDDFSERLEAYFDGKIAGLDFKSPTAKETINQWVEEKTQEKIKQLVSEVKESDRMFLINAIYFKAQWAQQFDKEKTAHSEFTLENGQVKEVPMMSAKSTKLSLYQDERFQLVEIPYGNGQFSMTVLLPQKGHTTQEIMELLNEESLKNWLNQSTTVEKSLYLPRFKMAYKVKLNTVLESMGMALPFSEQADFSGFFREATGQQLRIDRVIHQSFIEVDEEGTEAAAATNTGVGVTSINLPVMINRPFVFLIREKHSGSVLFAGKLMDPS
ncbi:serpin family protein [Rapidithrix thailandica]|uniref:Serpin family protein n=1 Tax=Rapidithrix thailandica TaxID=413964 RepID=A0AAW9S5G4_9BACT